MISRKSVQEYRQSTKSIPEIALELGADVLVEGGIQIAGSVMRLNAQIINASTDESLWANTYNRELTAKNIFQIQTEISQAIAGAVQVSLTSDDTARLAVIPTENLAAYRAYHQAMEQPTSSDDRRLMLAQALDPEFDSVSRQPESA